MSQKEKPLAAGTASGLTVNHQPNLTPQGAESQPFPFTCACDGSGWVEVGQEGAYIDLGDGYGSRLAGAEPVLERCDCSIPPMLEHLDEETDTEGGF